MFLLTEILKILPHKNTGPSTNNAPFLLQIFYNKIIGMQFCNIIISYSSTPYNILGEVFKLKL